MTGVDVARALLEGFLRALREAGVGAAVQGQDDFFRALAALRPDTLDRLYWTARVTLVSHVEDLPVFDAIFDACFRHAAMPAAVEQPPAPDESGETAAPSASEADLPEQQEWAEGAGVGASGADLTHRRRFARTSDADLERLAALRHAIAHHLPQTSTRRLHSARRGQRLDLRRIQRSATRSGGEVVRLHWRARPRRTRRLLLLIDVSGSLKQHTPALARFAHAALRGATLAEAFTFGTRLTRVTEALQLPDVDDALAAVADVVLDAEGGTRIGAALEQLLDNRSFVAHARGALIVIVSDGLERGDPTAMVEGVERLSRLGHRLVWWSPLACDPAYRPLTQAMAAVLPTLDHLCGVRNLDDARDALADLPDVCARPRRGAAHDWSR